MRDETTQHVFAHLVATKTTATFIRYEFKVEIMGKGHKERDQDNRMIFNSFAIMEG